MRTSSPAQLALIELPSSSVDDRAAPSGDDEARARREARRREEQRREEQRREEQRREEQAVINVRQCQALLDVIARVPPAGAAVPPARPSRRLQRARVEERRIRQLAELYAAFERTQAEGGVAVPPADHDDARRRRGRGDRVA